MHHLESQVTINFEFTGKTVLVLVSTNISIDPILILCLTINLLPISPASWNSTTLYILTQLFLCQLDQRVILVLFEIKHSMVNIRVTIIYTFWYFRFSLCCPSSPDGHEHDNGHSHG